MCPEVLFDQHGERIRPVRPESGYTAPEKEAFRQLAKHQLAKQGKSKYFGWTSSAWIDEESQHGVFCPSGLKDSEFWPIWADTQLVTPDESELLVWWLIKLGRLPFRYDKRRLAKQRVTNQVGLGPSPTRAWLRGFGTICLSKEQVEKIIERLEQSLIQQQASAEPLLLDTSPSTLSLGKLGSERPLAECIWTEWPSDECNNAERCFWQQNNRSDDKHRQINETKEPGETWLCPVQWWYAPNPAPVKCLLDPVIVLGNSLHALRQRQEVWPLRLRDDFQELRRLFEYAASLLAVTCGDDWRAALTMRPPSLKTAAPHIEAVAPSQQDLRRILVPHPDGDQFMAPHQRMSNSEEVYAHLSGFADCSLGGSQGDMSEAMATAPPMSAKEAQLGNVYDEILLLLDAAWGDGRFALNDTFKGWQDIWPKLSDNHRRRLGELFAQKGELLFDLQGELKLPICNCPPDAPAAPPEWGWEMSSLLLLAQQQAWSLAASGQ